MWLTNVNKICFVLFRLNSPVPVKTTTESLISFVSRRWNKSKFIVTKTCHDHAAPRRNHELTKVHNFGGVNWWVWRIKASRRKSICLEDVPFRIFPRSTPSSCCNYVIWFQPFKENKRFHGRTFQFRIWRGWRARQICKYSKRLLLTFLLMMVLFVCLLFVVG